MNNKLEVLLKWAAAEGFERVDTLVWVKRTVNGKVKQTMGRHLLHGHELCLMFRKGMDHPDTRRQRRSNVIEAMVTELSEKPVDMYRLMEELVPSGHYLELFGRRRNLRNGWMTVGNELI